MPFRPFTPREIAQIYELGAGDPFPIGSGLTGVFGIASSYPYPFNELGSLRIPVTSLPATSSSPVTSSPAVAPSPPSVQVPLPTEPPPSSPPATQAPPPATSSPPSTTSPSPPSSSEPSSSGPIEGEPVDVAGPLHDYEGYDYGEGPQVMRFPRRPPVIQEGEVLTRAIGPYDFPVGEVLSGLGKVFSILSRGIEALGPLGVIFPILMEPHAEIPTWPSAPKPKPIPEPPLERSPESMVGTIPDPIPRPQTPPASYPTPRPRPSVIGTTAPSPGSFTAPLPKLSTSNRTAVQTPTTMRIPSLATSPSLARFATPTPTPAPTAFATPTPTPAPTAFAPPAPPLTPVNTVSLQSAACELPQQRDQRRAKQRETCQKLVKIKVRAHYKRVCVSEALKHEARHIGKEIGKYAGKEVKKGLAKLGLKAKKLPSTRRRRVPDVAIPGTNMKVDVNSALKKLIPKPTRGPI